MINIFIFSDHPDFKRVSKVLGEYERKGMSTVTSSATRGTYFWANVLFYEETKKRFFEELGDIVVETTQKEISMYEAGFVAGWKAGCRI